MDAPDMMPYEHERDLAFLVRVKRATLAELSAMYAEAWQRGEPEDWVEEAFARAFDRLVG